MKVVRCMSFMIYGKNSVLEALKARRKFVKTYIQTGTNDDIILKMNAAKIPVFFLEKKQFGEKYQGHNQGVVAEVEDYRTLTLEQFLTKTDITQEPVILMLDEIQDPHNLGAIVRSAEAGGVKAVIIPKNRSVGITPAVVKTASGAIEYVDIIEVVNLTQTAEKLKSEGYWIVGTTPDAKMSYEEIYIDRPLCVIIGNEGKGMGRLLKEHCDLLVKIPMRGRINSLNASVSAGIIIFDISRRKQG